MAAGAVAAVAGAGLQVIGQERESRIRQRNANEQARLIDVQRRELLDRFNVFTARDIERERQLIQSAQQAAFIKGGVDVGSGMPLSVLEETAKLASEEFVRSRREALFDSEILRQEAGFTRQAARDERRSTRLQQGSTILSSFGRAGFGSGRIG